MLGVMSARMRPGRTAALVLGLCLALAACGGGDDDVEGDGPSSQETAPPAQMQAFSPLTGLPVDRQPDHPVVVVKIDNSSASSPQVGLGGADLVVQELVEGGITRLAVAFDQRIPKVVGPVRSMRTTDIGILQPAKAVLVASGGAPQTVGRMSRAGVQTFTEGATGYFREPTRRAPYNLMMNLGELVRSLEEGDRPTAYLPFSEDGADFPGGVPAAGLVARFSSASATTWQFQGGTYRNLNSFAGQGDTFEPATVLVLRVRVGDAGYLDAANNPVPETIFSGKGQALVFHDGSLVRGRWSKSGLDAELELSTKAGELKLPPGKVWIELVPAQGGDVTVTR